MNIEAQVVSISDIALSFPRRPEREMARDNFVDFLFPPDESVVFVNGEPGVGKTTLLSQYTRKFYKETICLFILSPSRIAYDPINLRFDLANQIEWHLRGERLPENASVDDAVVRQLFMELQRRIVRTKKTFTVVIDGLDQIPPHDSDVVDALFGLLPIGVNNFKFLFSGPSEKLLPNSLNRIRPRHVVLAPFSLHETIEYFSDIGVTKSDVEQIYRIWRGMPLRMATVRRLLISGATIESLLDGFSEQDCDLFDYEWRPTENLSDDEIKAIALLSHDPQKRDPAEICRITGACVGVVSALPEKLTFIERCDDDKFGFVSESFRMFAASKLTGLKDEITNLYLDYLKIHRDSRESLTELPRILSDKGRHDELIAALNKPHFLKLIDNSESLSVVEQQLGLGILSAANKQLLRPLSDFSLQRSAINELKVSEIHKAEIEALIAVGDTAEAKLLARSEKLTEDRISLLAFVARAQKEKGEESDVADEIAQLYRTLDASSLKRKRALQIAKDVFPITPEVAFRLIEESTSSSDENAIDSALVELTIDSLRTGRPQEHGNNLELVKHRAKTDDLRDLLESAAAFVVDDDYMSVIAEIEKLPKPGERLFLYRQWAKTAKFGENLVVVMERALALSISTTEFTPNSAFYCDILVGLPKIADEARRTKILGTVDAQKSVLADRGPAADYVRLQMLLAEAESLSKPGAARDRLVELYFYVVSEISDPVMRGICLSWFYAKVGRADPEGIIEREEQLSTAVCSDLRACVDEVLDGAAEHFEATKRIIEPLAYESLEFGLEISSSLNTLPRRDQSYSHFVKRMFQTGYRPDIALGAEAISFIESRQYRDEAIEAAVNWICKQDINPLDETNIATWTSLIKTIHHPDLRCNALAKLCKLLTPGTLRDSAMSSLESSWESLVDTLYRVSVGFSVSSIIAKYDKKLAKEWIKRSNDVRENLQFESESGAESHAMLTNIAIRIYAGIVNSRIEKDDDCKIIETLIGNMSDAFTLSSWTRLACIYDLSGNKKQCNRIVDKFIRPILKSFNECNLAQQWSSFAIAAPALWADHHESTIELLRTTASPSREEAIWGIVDYIFGKNLPGDPVDETYLATDLSYIDAIDVTTLLNEMDDDSFLYTITQRLVEHMISSNKKGRIKKDQLADICDRVNRIAEKKLPNQKYIRHEGYLIAVEAQIGRVNKVSQGEWMRLADRARKLGNSADFAYVLAIIAEAMPSRCSATRNELLKESRKIVDGTKSIHDKLDRLSKLAEVAWQINVGLAQECIKEAISLTTDNRYRDEPLAKKQQDLIDLAYRIDPEFAGSLASVSESETTKKKSTEFLKKRIEFHEKKERLSGSGYGIDERPDKDYPNAAWMLFSSLNARRQTPLAIKEIRNAITLGSKYTLDEAYPIFCWAFESLRVKYENTPQATEYLRAVFDAVTSATDTIGAIASIPAAKAIRERWGALVSIDKKGITVHPGMREDAIDYLKKVLFSKSADYLKICDPYFGVEDLEVLRLVLDVNPNCQITVLTSEKQQTQSHAQKPYDEYYMSYWRRNLSNQDPPPSTIYIVDVDGSGASPIHDRWWVSSSGGIRMGTSYNSLGIGKICELSEMSEEDAAQKEREIDRFTKERVTLHDGRRIRYAMFTL